MASKRTIKKQLNGMILDIAEECFYIQDAKSDKAEAADKLIDEALNYQVETLENIHQAKDKKAFGAIRESMEKKAIYFVEQMNGLQ